MGRARRDDHPDGGGRTGGTRLPLGGGPPRESRGSDGALGQTAVAGPTAPTTRLVYAYAGALFPRSAQSLTHSLRPSRRLGATGRASPDNNVGDTSTRGAAGLGRPVPPPATVPPARGPRRRRVRRGRPRERGHLDAGWFAGLLFNGGDAPARGERPPLVRPSPTWADGDGGSSSGVDGRPHHPTQGGHRFRGGRAQA